MWKDAHMLFTCSVCVRAWANVTSEHCVVADNHNNCYSNQQWSHRPGASKRCREFWYLWLNIIISNSAVWSDIVLLSRPKKERVCVRTPSLWPLRNCVKIWKNIPYIIFSTLLQNVEQSPFIWQENQTYCTTTHPDRHIINFQKRSRVTRHSFRVCAIVEVHNIETWWSTDDRGAWFLWWV